MCVFGISISCTEGRGMCSGAAKCTVNGFRLLKSKNEVAEGRFLVMSEAWKKLKWVSSRYENRAGSSAGHFVMICVCTVTYDVVSVTKSSISIILLRNILFHICFYYETKFQVYL